MATLTNIQGTLFNASGGVVNTGILYISLQQDIITIDGTKAVPSTKTVDLVATNGFINVSLYATDGASPAGVFYFVEYDPNPADTTRTPRQKEGYWWNYWNVPTGGPVSVGAFPPAHTRPSPGEVLPAAPNAAPAPDFQVVVWASNAMTTSSVTKTGSIIDLDGAVIMSPNSARPTEAGSPVGQYTPAQTLEFTATFGNVSAQHIGFALDMVSAPWAIFSTFDGSSVFARSNPLADTRTDLEPIVGTSLRGSSHAYKIEWLSSSVKFYVDGTLVATHNDTLSTAMNVLASDFLRETSEPARVKLRLSNAILGGQKLFI